MGTSRFVRWLDTRFYPGVEGNWDDTLFRDRVLRVLKSSDRLLDVGGGAGILPQMNFRGLAAHIEGVDLDPRVTSNPNIDVGHVANAEAMPFADESFDVVIADNVAEHLENPDAVFAEIRRVLRPGGLFLFKTPNSSHYMPLISRLTPIGFHKFYNRLRGRNSEDTFQTCYRANSRARVLAIARRSGFKVDYVERVESRPEYLRISAWTYLAGILYERMVNLTPAMAPFRILLMAQLRKN